MSDDSASWTALSGAYADAVEREDSFDRILDWPAQRAAVGDVRGKRVLDLGCGTGQKALALLKEGASEVVGVDISKPFIDGVSAMSVSGRATFLVGDLNELEALPELMATPFDMVLCLQSFGYARDKVTVLGRIRSMLAPGGLLVLSRAHPMRFAVERAEASGIGLGSAYHDTEDYTYTSGWDPSVKVTHTLDTFSDMHNTLTAAGFVVESVQEPWLSADVQSRFPHKQAWMDKYFGIVMFVARAR